MRALRALRRHGPLRLARIAASRARTRIWLDEEHVWYDLELPAGGAAPFADPELELRSPGCGPELDAFAALPTITPAGAAERMDQGGEPWLVLERDGEAVFACWLFRKSAPALAARGGWFELPAGVVCLEDSVASPRARGRGIAPRTWAALADRLAADSARSIVTKVETTNDPSRRAVTKAGFREIAIMRLRRRWPFERVELEILVPGVADELDQRLARRR